MPEAMPHPDVLTRARELRDSGATFVAIAAALQAEQYPTGRGARWNGTSAFSLLTVRHPHAAFLAPCTVCGDLTSSKYGICVATPACNRAYQRQRWAALRPEDTSTSKPCTSCGRPTVAEGGVCARPSCWNAYQRERTASQGGGSSVYAVWLPSPRILKLGFSAYTASSKVVCGVRGRAKERNWDTAGDRCIWMQPGDTRTEAWMQATLAFRWRAAFEEKGGRICEWFAVPELTVKEITEVVDGIYRLVPPDLVTEAPRRLVSAAC